MRRNTNRLLRISILFLFLITLDVLPVKYLNDIFFAVNGLLAVGFFLDISIFAFLSLAVLIAMSFLNAQISFVILAMLAIPLVLKIVSQYTDSKERVYLFTMFMGVVAIQTIYVIVSPWPGFFSYLSLVFYNSMVTLVVYSVTRILMLNQTSRF